MYFCLMITMFGVYYNTSNYLEFSLSTNVNRIHKTFLFVLKCHYYDKHRIRHMYTRKYLKHQHFLTLSLFQSCKNEFVLRKLHKGRSGRKSVTKQTSPPIYCHIKIITMGVNGQRGLLVTGILQSIFLCVNDGNILKRTVPCINLCNCIITCIFVLFLLLPLYIHTHTQTADVMMTIDQQSRSSSLDLSI